MSNYNGSDDGSLVIVVAMMMLGLIVIIMANTAATTFEEVSSRDSLRTLEFFRVISSRIIFGGGFFLFVFYIHMCVSLSSHSCVMCYRLLLSCLLSQEVF